MPGVFYTKVDRTVHFSYRREVIHLARRWLQPGQPIPLFVLVASLLLFWIEEVESLFVCLYERFLSDKTYV